MLIVVSFFIWRDTVIGNRKFLFFLFVTSKKGFYNFHTVLTTNDFTFNFTDNKSTTCDIKNRKISQLIDGKISMHSRVELLFFLNDTNLKLRMLAAKRWFCNA